MYRVLIVDDEETHRRGIMQLLGRMRPEYFLLDARDGKVAELILETVHIDIILTDIRMPNKTGLEFLADLYELNHQAKVLIVSGYGQFEYAKRAMELGAAGFLLKPIDPDELESTLDRVEEQIKEEQLHIRHQRGYIDYLLVKMVNGTLQKGEKEQLNGILPRGKAGFVFVLRYQGGEKNYLQRSFIELKQMMKKRLEDVGHVLMFEVFDSPVFYAGIVFLEEASVSSSQELLEELCKRIYEMIKTELDLGMSMIVPDLYEQMKNAYAQAKIALNQVFYFPGEGHYYSLEQENRSKCDVLKLISEQEEEWENLIRYSGHGEIKAALSDLFAQILQSNMPNVNRLKEIFVVFGIRLANWMQKKRMFEEYHQAIAMYTKEIMDAEYIQDMQKAVENLFLLLNDILHQKMEQDSVIELALRYMEEHLGEEITLPQLANLFFFTPSYFSIYFKGKTGETFSQKLKVMRIEKACDLLCKTNKKVSEIAGMTGYNDATYFGKVFKKYIGCSPEEYRKRSYIV